MYVCYLEQKIDGTALVTIVQDECMLKELVPTLGTRARLKCFVLKEEEKVTTFNGAFYTWYILTHIHSPSLRNRFIYGWDGLFPLHDLNLNDKQIEKRSQNHLFPMDESVKGTVSILSFLIKQSIAI